MISLHSSVLCAIDAVLILFTLQLCSTARLIASRTSFFSAWEFKRTKSTFHSINSPVRVACSNTLIACASTKALKPIHRWRRKRAEAQQVVDTTRFHSISVRSCTVGKLMKNVRKCSRNPIHAINMDFTFAHPRHGRQFHFLNGAFSYQQSPGA